MAGYDVFRDGVLIASLGNVLAYADTSTTPGVDHTYTVRATDASGNDSVLSSPVTVTQPSAAPPLFADGFETGDLSAWTASSGLTVEQADTATGTNAAEGNTTTGATYVKKSLGSTYTDAYARVAFEVKSQTSQVTLLRLRDQPTGVGGYVYMTATGKLGFRSDALAAGTTSAFTPGPGWHVLELHLSINGPNSVAEVWVDGAAIPDLTFATIDLGSAPIGVLQVGDTAGGTWDVVFDDAGFGTSRLGPNADTSAPAVPTNVTASATSPFTVLIGWDPAFDNIGVVGYDVFRDGSLLAQVTLPGFTDSTVLAGSTHIYAVRARDAAGNVSTLSAPISVTTGAAPAPLFADGFESGDLSAFTTSNGLVVEQGDVNSGGFAAEGNTTTGATFAKETLPSTYMDAYARVAFEVKSQSSQVTLLRLRDGPVGNGAYLYMTSGGKLGFRSDAEAAGRSSAATPGPGWHVVELHVSVGTGVVEVWLDGAAVPDLTLTGVNLGPAPMAVLQIGDTASGTWDVVFDDAGFGTGRLGPTADETPPSMPAGLSATATSPFSVQVSWTASTDDVAVAEYDLMRDGVLLAQPTTTSYTDSSVLADSTHTYSVRARDLSGNVSSFSAAVSVTVPSAGVPVFADGFESADSSAWTVAPGLTVESTDVRTGGFAAEGNTTAGLTFAKKTLSGTYPDAYARVAFEVIAQASGVTLLRLRDTSGGVNGGFIALTAGGKLQFRDAAGAATNSSIGPGPGWHVLELHLSTADGTVEVWLDGAPVPDLTRSGANLGGVPIGVLQIGDTNNSGTWDVVFDDAAFGTGRLGVGGDVTPPTAPANLAGSATSPFSVLLTWDASSDDIGVTGYDVMRDGAVIDQVASPGYVDSSVLAQQTYEYTVRARDASGNVSGLSTSVFVTTPAAALPTFVDGFETGDGSAWNPFSGLTVESGDVGFGGYSAEGNPAAGAAFAKRNLPSGYRDAYARVAFEIKSQSTAVTVLRLRDTPTGNGGYLFVNSSGRLAFHNDAANTTSTSATAPGPGWHVVELHLQIDGGVVETWLDGVAVSDLAFSGVNLGSAALGVLQIGDTASGTWDVVFDNAAFGTTRLGPTGDITAPTAPGNLVAATPTAFSVQLTWDASTDDVGVTVYDVLRDGTPLAQVTTTGYTDSTVLASTTHQYAVRARDASANISLSSVVTVTTPSAAAPTFADGFESGSGIAWTTFTGLAVVGPSDVHTGAFAAEGVTAGTTAFAKRTVTTTCTDCYARVAFEVKSQTSQVTLLRLRDTPTGKGGFLFLTSTGKLAFRSDALTSATTSSVSPVPGWHVLELHLKINGAASAVEVWLDGSAVPDLTFNVTDLGSAPVGVLQIGDTVAGTWDIVFDDAALGTSRIGVQ